MAFHVSALPSIAAATTDLWPSLANTLLVPWRGPIAASKSAKSRPSLSQSPGHDPNSLRSQPESAVIPTKTELPGFLRNAILSNMTPIHQVANMAPTNIHTQILSMSRQSLAMADPLFRRSFATVRSSRPLGAVIGIRSVSTYRPHHSSMLRPTSSPLQTQIQAANQYRVFGSGGISRSLLANLEAGANRNPTSPTAQNSFYQLLLRANMPAIVVERYQSGRFATNEAADEAYQKALAMISGTTGTAAPGALSSNQVQAIGQAVAATTKGGTVAVGKGSGGKDGAIHVIVEESIGSVIFRWVKFLLWFGLITYLSLVVVTMLIDGMNLFKRTGPGRMDNQEAKAENQKTRFADVHGCDEAKEELQDLVEFLRNPDKFNTLGGKLPKGVLLVGPPGTGKTLLARAVAGEAGVPFFYMSGSEFDEIYVGVGAKRVRELFAAAKAKSPSIIFIDELDAIGSRRNSRDAAYVKQTLNQLLTELDGFETNSGVIIIGATNFPESLDKALTRPGRFDRHVQVDLPDVRGRIAILKHHATKIKMSPDVDLAAIAGLTSGLSGAELENIVNQAAIHASKAKAKFASQTDFDWAKDRVLMGAEKKSMVVSAKEKEMTAYHEAGHALVSLYAGDVGFNLYKVTVLPRGHALGVTWSLPEQDKYSYRVRDYRAHIDKAMGGKVAEELVFGKDNVTSGVSSDLKSATGLAYQMVSQFGMSDTLGPVNHSQNYQNLSSETKSAIEAEVKRILNDSYDRTRVFLESKKNELDLLAKALVEYETLDKSEVEKVIKGEKLTGRVKVPPGPMKIPVPEDAIKPGELPPIPGGRGEDGPGGSPPPAPPAAGGVAA